MPSNAASGKPYSPTVGLIYVFNLIVGTGALTMPGAFVAAGWLLGLFFVVVLAFMSYITTTYVIETMASANAIIRLDNQRNVQDAAHHDVDSTSGNDDERQSLLHNDDSTSEDHTADLFEISKKVEMVSSEIIAMYMVSSEIIAVYMVSSEIIAMYMVSSEIIAMYMVSSEIIAMYMVSSEIIAMYMVSSEIIA
ncbi:hypothetical protein NP493_101g09017 [Ridgeia piscesae]|uniref:Amino acid transporter transmembrane domain-containing protein n=1 Tax=Ridgeia piscesae TaxID=27915 RepID=A0AAD9UHL3_RIDPI|nr:hypothetical protein NP493_101g09017 [Ridgeia piscesae]